MFFLSALVLNCLNFRKSRNIIGIPFGLMKGGSEFFLTCAWQIIDAMGNCLLLSPLDGLVFG